MNNTLPPTFVSWLFLDLNSYFASVEQQEVPALRGRPVAVVPMNTDSTCAIAASYEAKAYGVKTGTKIYEAKKMCPGLRCVLARHDVYVRYHHKVIDEVIKYVPINKIWSVDELSSRLPPRLRDPEAARDVALKIKEGLRRNVGEFVRCSIGLAPNSFLAKVATDMQKPDGLVTLLPGELPGPLLKLKLTDLPGINVNMERRLAHADIRSVEQFWNLSPKHARRVWGSVEGERFWYNLHGFDIPDRETQTRVVGHSRVLDPALRTPHEAYRVTRRLLTKAASRLRRKEFYATILAFSTRTVEGERWAGEAKMAPSQDNFSFLKALDDLWDTMLCDLIPRRLKKVSVTLHGLCRREDITPDLFNTTSTAYQELQQKHDRISELMDGLNQRYGAHTIQLGPSPRTNAGYVGTKIAFSRVPDLAEFEE